MPKPKNKKELLEKSSSVYYDLITLINSYSDKELEKEFPEDKLNKNVRDVLTHLHHWHVMLLNWYAVGLSGDKPDVPAKGYTWQTLPALNIEIWKKYQNTNTQSAIELLEDSFSKVQKIIAAHSNEELFGKKVFNWTGSSSLAGYIILNTSSHYNWAIKRIKKSLK